MFLKSSFRDIARDNKKIKSKCLTKSLGWASLQAWTTTIPGMIALVESLSMCLGSDAFIRFPEQFRIQICLRSGVPSLRYLNNISKKHQTDNWLCTVLYCIVLYFRNPTGLRRPLAGLITVHKTYDNIVTI